MKMRYIRDDMEVSPQFRKLFAVQYEELKAADDIVEKHVMRDGRVQPIEYFRQGAVVDHPNAWREVQQGTAVPADVMCAARCGMSEADMQVKQLHYDMLVRHLQSDDEDLFVNGVITGADPNTGDYIPGPNWDRLAEFRPMAAEASDEEDEGI